MPNIKINSLESLEEQENDFTPINIIQNITNS
jgi:hypothetical protein